MQELLSLSRNPAAVQVVFDIDGDKIERLLLPDPETSIVGGVRWGRADALFTPAFWAARAWYCRHSPRFSDYSWGTELRDEIVGCLLGGHGITSEVNKAAFQLLEASGLLEPGSSVNESEIFALLADLRIGGRLTRYRFPRQKSAFIATALRKLDTAVAIPVAAKEMRSWLMTFPGIGPKTASWITRNHLRTAAVAVIDIHIFRAGVIMGLFNSRHDIGRHYFAMEALFLELARRIGVPAQELDVLIWRTMKDSGHTGLNAYRAAA
ncbi:MAG: N-glycosylase/DNA lyase [Verrucomicrobiota bacterium]